MRRTFIPAMMLAVSQSATAQTPAMLNCAVDAVPGGLADDLARASIDQSMPDREAPKVALGKIVAGCVKTFNIAEPGQQIYARYTLARVVSQRHAAAIRRSGLEPRIADKALALGPANTMDFSAGIPALVVEKLIGAYISAGVDADKVSQTTWTQLGGYVAMTSLMWQMRSQLVPK